MGLKNFFQGILICCLLLFANSCDLGKKSKSDIEVVFTQDTLDVGYTYWWPESGPFIGACGEELSLVFSGILTELKAPTDDPGPLYVSQEGIIKIDRLFKIKELNENTYANQKFFSSDSFHESGLTVGDTVLVFCYDYEDNYSIPGDKSIIKITSLEDPLIKSIKKYIDEDQDAVKIKKDIGLWATQDCGRALEDIIACQEDMKTGTDSEHLLNNE